MKRKDFKNFVWYPVTDETYWVDDDPEFPGCQTIVTDGEIIYTQRTIYLGWGTMAKQEDYGWRFMIIEL